MGKNFIFVIALSLVIGALSTHWLNVASSSAPMAIPVKMTTPENVSKLRKQSTQSGPASTLPRAMKPQRAQVTQIEVLLNTLAKNLYAENQDFDQQRKDLSEAMSKATSEDISTLADVTTDVTRDKDQRSSAVYLLTLGGPGTIPALASVVVAPIKKASGSHFELALRTTALERLDKFSAEGVRVEDVIKQALKHPLHPTLRMLAQVSLQGIRQNRPGKLTRFAQKSLEETP